MTDFASQLRSLELAAYGWSPADWQRLFYPEDLPQEWRISYYANEFASVLLPVSVWDELPARQAVLWMAEVRPEFRFFAEITPALLRADHWSQVQEAIEKHLFQQVQGLWVTVDAVTALPNEWQGQFALHVQQAGELLAVPSVSAGVHCGLLRTTEPLSPQILRQVFEQLKTTAAYPDVLLFLDTPWRTVEQIRLMQQLYGI
ncbi:MAG: hypothetical protein JG718_13115 [Candidatus Thiothrix moscowensis]|nr:hypothetical protein [Candidatus Thiothrix moscowensis]